MSRGAYKQMASEKTSQATAGATLPQVQTFIKQQQAEAELKQDTQHPLPPPVGPAVAGPQIVIAGDDDLTRAIHAQAAVGLKKVEDFRDVDADFDPGDRPPGLPDHHDGRELKYLFLSPDDYKSDARVSKGYAVAVTRQSLPSVPEHLFNARGFVQVKNKIVCVIYKDLNERWRAKDRRRFDALIASSQPVFEVKERDGDRMGTFSTTVSTSVGGMDD